MEENSENNRKIEFDVFTICIQEDWYYEITVLPEKVFGVDNLKQVVESEQKLGSRVLPVLILVKQYATTTSEFLFHLAKPNSNPFAKAEAYVIHSLNQKILGNFYLKMIKPRRPTKVFTLESEAKKWLKQFSD